jgi:DNA-directed RNA polymerase alpha subunit
MDEKINNQSIERLDITCATIKKLKDSKITKIGQLCKKSRTDLKELSFESYEINKIDIELQLLGLNLRGSL